MSAETVLIIRDRTREIQLLERCLRLEQALGQIRKQHMRRCGARDWRTAAETDAKIVQLRDIARLSWKEIGAQVGLAESTVSYRYDRAKRADGPR